MRPPELTAALALHGVQRHDWHVQGCCALSGEGLEDGLRWLADAVRKKGNGAASAASPAKSAATDATTTEAAGAPAAPATPAAAAVSATEKTT